MEDAMPQPPPSERRVRFHENTKPGHLTHLQHKNIATDAFPFVVSGRPPPTGLEPDPNAPGLALQGPKFSFMAVDRQPIYPFATGAVTARGVRGKSMEVEYERGSSSEDDYYDNEYESESEEDDEIVPLDDSESEGEDEGKRKLRRRPLGEIDEREMDPEVRAQLEKMRAMLGVDAVSRPASPPAGVPRDRNGRPLIYREVGPKNRPASDLRWTVKSVLGSLLGSGSEEAVHGSTGEPGVGFEVAGLNDTSTGEGSSVTPSTTGTTTTASTTNIISSSLDTTIPSTATTVLIADNTSSFFGGNTASFSGSTSTSGLSITGNDAFHFPSEEERRAAALSQDDSGGPLIDAYQTAEWDFARAHFDQIVQHQKIISQAIADNSIAWVNVLKDPAKQAENFENLLKKQWPLWMERQNTSTPMFPQLSYGLVNRCMLCIEQTKGYVLDTANRYRLCPHFREIINSEDGGRKVLVQGGPQTCPWCGVPMGTPRVNHLTICPFYLSYNNPDDPDEIGDYEPDIKKTPAYKDITSKGAKHFEKKPPVVPDHPKRPQFIFPRRVGQPHRRSRFSPPAARQYRKPNPALEVALGDTITTSHVGGQGSKGKENGKGGGGGDAGKVPTTGAAPTKRRPPLPVLSAANKITRRDIADYISRQGQASRRPFWETMTYITPHNAGKVAQPKKGDPADVTFVRRLPDNTIENAANIRQTLGQLYPAVGSVTTPYPGPPRVISEDNALWFDSIIQQDDDGDYDKLILGTKTLAQMRTNTAAWADIGKDICSFHGVKGGEVFFLVDTLAGVRWFGDTGHMVVEKKKDDGDGKKDATGVPKTADSIKKTGDTTKTTGDTTKNTTDDTTKKTSDATKKTAEDSSKKTADDTTKATDDTTKTADDTTKAAGDTTKTADDATKTADDTTTTADDKAAPAPKPAPKAKPPAKDKPPVTAKTPAGRKKKAGKTPTGWAISDKDKAHRAKWETTVRPDGSKNGKRWCKKCKKVTSNFNDFRATQHFTKCHDDWKKEGHGSDDDNDEDGGPPAPGAPASGTRALKRTRFQADLSSSDEEFVTPSDSSDEESASSSTSSEEEGGSESDSEVEVDGSRIIVEETDSSANTSKDSADSKETEESEEPPEDNYDEDYEEDYEEDEQEEEEVEEVRGKLYRPGRSPLDPKPTVFFPYEAYGRKRKPSNPDLRAAITRIILTPNKSLIGESSVEEDASDDDGSSPSPQEISNDLTTGSSTSPISLPASNLIATHMSRAKAFVPAKVTKETGMTRLVHSSNISRVSSKTGVTHEYSISRFQRSVRGATPGVKEFTEVVEKVVEPKGSGARYNLYRFDKGEGAESVVLELEGGRKRMKRELSDEDKVDEHEIDGEGEEDEDEDDEDEESEAEKAEEVKEPEVTSVVKTPKKVAFKISKTKSSRTLKRYQKTPIKARK